MTSPTRDASENPNLSYCSGSVHFMQVRVPVIERGTCSCETRYIGHTTGQVSYGMSARRMEHVTRKYKHS